MNIPFEQRSIQVNLPFSPTVQLCRQALERMGAKIIDAGERSDHAILVARTDTWLLFTGEELLVLIETASEKGCVVRVASKSQPLPFKSKKVNRNNLDDFEKTLSSLGTAYVQKQPPQAPLKTAWEVLGLKPGASPAEIERAYRERIRLYHPDRVAGLAPEFIALAEEHSRLINAAYAELTKKIKS